MDQIKPHARTNELKALHIRQNIASKLLNESRHESKNCKDFHTDKFA